MRLHIVEGQLSTQPHRVCLFDDERAEVVRIVNAHESEAEDLRESNKRLSDMNDHAEEQLDEARSDLDVAQAEIKRLTEELDAIRRTSSAAE